MPDARHHLHVGRCAFCTHSHARLLCTCRVQGPGARLPRRARRLAVRPGTERRRGVVHARGRCLLCCQRLASAHVHPHRRPRAGGATRHAHSATVATGRGPGGRGRGRWPRPCPGPHCDCRLHVGPRLFVERSLHGSSCGCLGVGVGVGKGSVCVRRRVGQRAARCLRGARPPPSGPVHGWVSSARSLAACRWASKLNSGLTLVAGSKRAHHECVALVLRRFSRSVPVRAWMRVHVCVRAGAALTLARRCRCAGTVPTLCWHGADAVLTRC